MNHKDYFQPFFIDEIKNFLIENQGNILNKVSSKLIEKGENIKTIKEEMGIILDNISNMLYFESEEAQNIEQIHSIKTDIKDLMDLYYEGFADAFAMKVLGIDINDFIKCFNVNGSGSLRKTKIDSDYDLGEIRILIQQYDKNSNNEPDKTTKENDSDEHFYLDKIRYDFIRIGDILAPCQEYINDCKNAIQKEIDDDKNKIGIQNIQDIYKVIKDDAININEKIDDFLNLYFINKTSFC